MRRTLIGLLTMGLVVGSASFASAGPAEVPGPPTRSQAAADLGIEASPAGADEALSVASRVMDGNARATDPSATVALRDLWLARPSLDGVSALEADGLLTRPTDGANDPIGNGYTVPSTRVCGANTCVHFVQATADAPPSFEWVQLVLNTMEATYATEVGSMGYRSPRPDGSAGGDNKLDIYLKDLGTGLYGYCAPEKYSKRPAASGYCVLDNDYNPAQFPIGTPETNLAVTAAHEFFHAVQYAYDVTEDSWMLESTATWMEERVVTDVNDNRQYLRFSQMQVPYVPLDAFSSTYGFQYGNWIFFEYLSQKYGNGFTKKVIQAASKKKGRVYSIQALQKVLRKKGGFSKVYADYQAANITPSRTYPEAPGVPEYADPKALADVTLSRSKRNFRKGTKINHLASEFMHVRPGGDLTNKKWRLRINVSSPRKAAAAGRVLLHKTNGKVGTKKIRFNRRGKGSIVVPFSLAKVLAVSISVGNHSTAYRCGRDSPFACGGKPLADKSKFKIKAKVVKKGKKRKKR